MVDAPTKLRHLLWGVQTFDEDCPPTGRGCLMTLAEPQVYIVFAMLFTVASIISTVARDPQWRVTGLAIAITFGGLVVSAHIMCVTWICNDVSWKMLAHLFAVGLLALVVFRWYGLIVSLQRKMKGRRSTANPRV